MSRRDLLSQRARSTSVGAGLVAMAVGGTALAGWLLGLPSLHTWRAASGGVPAGSALGLLLLGVGLVLVAPAWKRRWVCRLALVPAAGALVLGVAALLGASTGLEVVPAGAIPAWRFLAPADTAALTALELILGALTLVLLVLGRRRGLVYAQVIALIMLGLAAVGVTGRLYGLDALLAASPFTGMSLPGLTGLLAVALGLLFARPEVGVMALAVDPSVGGISVRRLLPLTVVLVVLLGALRVWGERRGFLPGPLGTALFAVTLAFMVGGLIVWNALRLREADRSLRREEEIRGERQRQFRHAIVEAPIPILMFAEDGEVLQVSRTVEEITGYPPEEIPDLMAWGRLTAGEEGERDAVRGLMLSLGEFRETTVRTRGGQKRTWRIRTSAVGALDEERSAYVTMAADLTEIREAEERKDEFLAILGHELRNPLAALGAGLELQRLQEDPEKNAATLDMMRRQVRHLGRLLDDLLDVSRISRGKIELQPEVVALDAAVERVVEEHRELLPGEEHTEISVRVPPRPVPVSADPTRLHQILGNLVGNAVKYTPGGGRVWVTLEREEEAAVVRVRDSGVGMDQHEIDAIFEPFRQLAADGGRRRGGLGLGLTLVRQLAKMHGGGVEAASRGPGRGSTFTLRLPLAADEELAAAVEQEASAAGEPEVAPCGNGDGQTPLRVLVVDDQVAVADGLAEVLALSGYDTAAAYRGHQALEREREQRPHVVLLDLDLPDIDGRTVARRIRARHDDRAPLLVAISGFGGKRHQELSREAGIDHHMVKPVDIQKLRELLAEAAASPPGPG